ncbi:drug/metabolite transporter (DMT)-like permease [Actinokineospora baliensis]|uniref:DMT family transporter n=1 Tax=Actinokineospora baliensis TaxID=547056 RepID=UPI00195DB62D|nr:DMT family transporter [Actinokineospora baliensis]MBM7770674.1 drug/metabolite transporter (DMT)-like permease [Actinokineospora baliensis]
MAAAVTTAILWASAFVVIRDAAPHFSAGALAEGRLLSGAAALLLLLGLRREGLPGRGAWPGIIGSGVLWFGGYMVVLNWGEKLVDAGTAAMLVNIGPILIALLGGWLLQEGFPPRLMLGLGVSFAGAIVVGVSTSGSGSSSVLGIGLCVLAAITYAAGVVLQKPALKHGSALQVTTFGCVIGAVATLPFSGQLVADLQTAPLSSTIGMVYLGLFPTALAFYTWAYALSRTTAGRMGATTYVVPALVLLMSWLFLGEVPAALTLVGGALCLLGVAVARSKNSSKNSSGSTSPASPVRLTRTRTDGDVI